MTENDFVYLDNAATTYPKPAEVLELACASYAARGVNPGRTGFDLALEAEAVIADCRSALCRFFGGEVADRLVFSHNVTDALNLVIGSVLGPGDHAVTTCLEHNSVLRPMEHHRRHGGEVDFVPFDGAGYVDPDDIVAAIRPSTKMVVVNHGSNVIGTVQPISEIGRRCRERGVLFVVDAAQTAGLVPIDVAAMHVDILCFTGHKSLMAPPGTGGMYVAEHVEIAPCRSGGTGVQSALRRQPDEYPWRLEFGTLNLLGIAGLLAAQHWIERQGGVDVICAHEMELAKRLAAGLAAVDGVEMYCAAMERDHLPVLAFNLEGVPADQVGTMLDVEHDVIARTGLHCAPRVHDGLGTSKRDGSVRFAPGFFTTEDEIDRAIAAVAEVAAWARSRAPVGA